MEKIITPYAYQLIRPPTIQQRHMFPLFILDPAPPNLVRGQIIRLPCPVMVDHNREFEIGEILDSKSLVMDLSTTSNRSGTRSRHGSPPSTIKSRPPLRSTPSNTTANRGQILDSLKELARRRGEYFHGCLWLSFRKGNGCHVRPLWLHFPVRD